MVNGYNVTMRGQRNQDRHVYVRQSHIILPDSVGKLILKSISFFSTKP